MTETDTNSSMFTVNVNRLKNILTEWIRKQKNIQRMREKISNKTHQTNIHSKRAV